jgi:hypothetical protein
MGFPLIGTLPIKKCPHALLHALGSLKYEASEWMFMTPMHEIRPLHVGVTPNNPGVGTHFPIFSVPFVCSLAIVLNVIKTVKLTALA